MKDWLENTRKFVKTANQLFILIKATLLNDRYDYVRVYEKYNKAYYLEEECEDEIWACVEQNDFDQLKKILNNVVSIIRKCARRSVNIECVIYFAKGYSHEEISSHFNIPVGTVKSRISNGRELIRKELGI